MKRKRKINGPFVAIPLEILDAPAWCAMDFIARALWIELRRKLRNYGLNNGKIFLSCRNAEKIGANKDTIARRFVELEHYGFLRKTSEGFLGSDGFGIAPHYRFTDLAHGTYPPTREFEKWNGELFVYTPRRAARKNRAARKKQIPVLSGRTLRIVSSDIRTAPGEGSVCIVPSDIGDASKCPVPSDISRLPLPAAGEAQIQGSSTVRAPAQAGDAGSSPAPVAKSDLTTMVLDIVTAQLNELESRRRRAA
jgi:hypothetical protein